MGDPDFTNIDKVRDPDFTSIHTQLQYGFEHC